MNKYPKYIINIRGNDMRLLNTIHELQKINYDDFYTIVKAITPENISSNKYHLYINYKTFENIIFPKSTSILPSFGALGCALSHMKVWDSIIDNDIEHALIMEDDICIDNPQKTLCELHDVYHFLCKEEKRDRDSKLMITFGSKLYLSKSNTDNVSYEFMNEHKRYHNISMQYIHYLSGENRRNELVSISGPFTGLHFYYINRNMCLFLKDKIQRIKYQIDIEIGLLSRYCSIFTMDSDSICQRKDLRSDVQLTMITLSDIEKNSCLPNVLNRCIYSYIPEIYKKKLGREIIFSADMHYI